MKRLSLLTVIALLGVLAFASVAEAHLLTLKRAKNASRADTSALCFQIPDCIAWAIGTPDRRSPHVVEVPAAHAYSDGVVCVWLDRWRIRNGSRRLHYNFNVFENTLTCDFVAARASSSTKPPSASDLSETEDAIRDEVLATR